MKRALARGDAPKGARVKRAGKLEPYKAKVDELLKAGVWKRWMSSLHIGKSNEMAPNEESSRCAKERIAMIHNDIELEATQTRIARFQKWLLEMRKTSSPKEFVAMSSGYRLESRESECSRPSDIAKVFDAIIAGCEQPACDQAPVLSMLNWGLLWLRTMTNVLGLASLGYLLWLRRHYLPSGV